MSHSTAEAGELSPRDPVEGRGHRQVAPLEGKTANTPRLGPVSTSRQRIAELARQAVGMAVAIAWLPGPAGTRRRVAKLSVEEPDAAEPARPDLWGARVSNDPGLPDPSLGKQIFRVYPGFQRHFGAFRGFAWVIRWESPCGSSWKTRSVFQGAVGAFCASTVPSASTGPVRVRQDDSQGGGGPPRPRTAVDR